MPLLQNNRHERFAQERVAGKNIIDAWQIASGTRTGNYSWKVGKRPDVEARIAELRGEQRAFYQKILTDAGAPLAISAARIAEELAKIAFANAESGTSDPAGTPPRELSKRGADRSGAVQALPVEATKPKDENGLTIRDRRLALLALGRHLGMFDGKPTRPAKPPIVQLPLKDRILSKEEWDAKVLNRGKK
jgi:phage terminase small subunit